MTPSTTSPHLYEDTPAQSTGDPALERMLANALVPVEPSPVFVSRLQARLVTHRGTGMHSPWFVLGVGAAGLILATAWMGLALRMLFVLLSFLGVVQSSRKTVLKRRHLAS